MHRRHETKESLLNSVVVHKCLVNIDKKPKAEVWVSQMRFL